MLYKLNNIVINIHSQQTIGEVTYAAGTFLKWTPQERLDFGITEEAEPATILTQAELDAAHNADVQSQIHQLELQDVMGRPAREAIAADTAHPAYLKYKALNDTIVVLRATLV